MADNQSPTGNPLADEKITEYEIKMQEAVALALDGQLTYGELRDTLLHLTTHYTQLLYVLGGGDATSKKAKAYFKIRHKINKLSAWKFARDVFNGRYSIDSEDENASD